MTDIQITFAVIVAIGGIVAGRVFSMPHASKAGVVGIFVVIVSAIAYMVAPGIVDGILGAGSRCILTGDGTQCPFGMSPWLLVGLAAALAALGYIAWSISQARKNQ